MKIKLLLIIFFSMFLSGCLIAFLAGATTGIIVYDNRDLQTMTDDKAISNLIVSSINKNPDFKGSNISASSFNKMVLLTGQTTEPELKAKAEKIAKGMKNVVRVYNEITIEEPISFSTKSNDTWLTTKVKTQLVAKSGLRSSNIKAITENGSVFLLGSVTEDQADLAINTVRQVSGVKRVVNAMQILRVANKSEYKTYNN